MKFSHLLFATLVVAIVGFAGLEYPLSATDDRTATTTSDRASSNRRIQPSDLIYLGAFRLPDCAVYEESWNWSGEALAYCPVGDRDGAADGFPGSLFGLGHDWKQYVSEITIPAPVVSKTKDVSELNTARTLQSFRDIRGDLLSEPEMPCAGLEYLSGSGRQMSGKLHFCWGQHCQEGETGPSHGSCDLDLATPNVAGLWRIGECANYSTNNYLFEIPSEWAAANAPGMRLATGRFREGGQCARGPSLIAYAPATDGNPPAAGTRLECLPLLHYTSVDETDGATLRDYHHSDQWTGGAWLNRDDRSAVVFVGTKGIGKCWYGFADGTVWPDEAPFPEIPPPPNDQRGFWSTRFEAQIIFYDPSDLAAVGKGRKAAHEPQPYASLTIDDCLFNVRSNSQIIRVRAAAFDRERGMLYITEFRGDEDKSLVHVWRIR